MIKTTVDGREVRIKKADIIRALNEGTKTEKIGALEILMGVGELKKVEGFCDYCEFASRRIAEDQKPMVYEDYLKRIRTAIENHGIPQKGHLDDHAKRLLTELSSPAYSDLIKDLLIDKSIKVVRKHYHEGRHSQDYEKHLNHLHQVVNDLKRRSHKVYTPNPSRKAGY